MSSNKLTKDNLNFYLQELAKEYRKLCGKRNPAEIILIGGASILINYNFRESTEDIDAIIGASSAIKDAVHHVGDKYDLGSDWFNSDFEHTSSYSPELILHSKHYKTYSNVVHYRTVSGEYLLAMKLVSNRLYKHDKSDLIGIIKAERELGNNITLDMIKKAVNDLYGDKVKIDNETYDELSEILNADNLDDRYTEAKKQEEENKKLLLDYIKEKPNNKVYNANETIKYIKNNFKK